MRSAAKATTPRNLPRPPEYGDGTAKEHCSHCRFYEETTKRTGKCTKYDVSVGWDKWCSSWAPMKPDAKQAWAEHRERLKEANG